MHAYIRYNRKQRIKYGLTSVKFECTYIYICAYIENVYKVMKLVTSSGELDEEVSCFCFRHYI